MKTSTEIQSKEIENIISKAKPFLYNRIYKMEWYKIMELKTMIKYRQAFEVESEKIGYVYTFTDCLV